jgi:hypothetical protein
MTLYKKVTSGTAGTCTSKRYIWQMENSLKIFPLINYVKLNKELESKKVFIYL